MTRFSCFGVVHVGDEGTRAVVGDYDGSRIARQVHFEFRREGTLVPCGESVP
jgi:hypothetical protein